MGDQDNNNNELKYSQADLDSILDKKMTNFSEKHVSKDQYNSLLSELNMLKAKEVFISNGGNKDNFQDFYKLEQDNLSNLKSEKDITKFYDEVKQSKSWAFGSGSTEPTKNLPNDKQVVSSILDVDDDLVDGTMYRNPILTKK